MSRLRSISAISAVLAFFIFYPLTAGAFQITKINGLPVSGDFTLNQAKTELELAPGGKASRVITLTNRSGADLDFTVSTEDFAPSTGGSQEIDLLAAKDGPYSLKNYLQPEVTSFVLRHGETITLPVAIALPGEVQPGGLYGAVVFSAQPSSGAAAVGANVSVVSRLASLFFVRVSGPVVENGGLVDFSSPKQLYWSGPVSLYFDYKNSGSVYLDPYGELKITDVFGRTAYSKLISPYYVLPGAVRQQKELFDRPSAWGLYQATLRLNRGYGNVIDQKSLYFFVISWPYMIASALAALLLLWLLWKALAGLKKLKRIPHD